MKKKYILYTSGVVPAVSAIIKAIANENDKILMLTPVYNCFFSSIANNNCIAECSILKYQNNTYTIDYQDFETKCKDDKVKAFLLSNPHNPTGRAFTKDELTKLAEICIANNVIIISDEIHCELVFENYKYVPFASLSEKYNQNLVVCTSPSKAFNIAGLQNANIYCENQDLLKAIDKALNINEVCDVNPFGVVALQAAYNDSKDWLKQVIKYLYKNFLYLKDFVNNNLQKFNLINLEATYLAWLDISKSGLTSDDFCDNLYKQTGLFLNSGTKYGPGGEGFVRINLACPKSTLKDATNRLLKFYQTYC